MPRLPRWVWVLVAIVLAGMAAYVGTSRMTRQPTMMKQESATPPAEAKPPQPGSKRFGGGVIRHGDPGKSGKAE
jgi:hypothetical protein